MVPDDKEFLLACRSGDQAAWEALVNRYQRLIYSIPRRAGLDEDASADVFQEVFTTLFEKLNEIEQPERLHAWLVTTARRKTWRIIEGQKKLGGRAGAQEGDEEELENLPDGALLADEVLLNLEEQDRVRAAVAKLDERCEKLITLLFYTAGPPSYAKIAAQLGTSEGSIGPARARCLDKLLRLLQK